jgi:hypothetical protein
MPSMSPAAIRRGGISLFIGEFMLGDMSKASLASEALRTTATKSHYLAARLIGAKATGRNQLGANRGRVDRQVPAADPRQTLAKEDIPKT